MGRYTISIFVKKIDGKELETEVKDGYKRRN